ASSNLSKYAKGEDLKPTEPFQGTEEEFDAYMDSMLLEIYDGDTAAMEAARERRETADKLVEPPIVDEKKVWQQADEHKEELKVIATFEDFLKDLGIRE